MSSVAVLGAGPAGLMAALVAAEAGHEVHVFEAGDRVGGMAASFEIAGQRVDFGSHRLHPATPEAIMARLHDLLGSDLQARERNGRIRLRDRWVAFPLRPLDMARSLPLGFTALVARDTVLGPIRRGSDGSFAGELTRRLGPTVVDEFYGPYSWKLYGADARDLDAEHAHRRVAASSPLAIVRRALQASRPDGRRFWYPRNGYGQIAEALAEAAVDAGATLHLQSPVTRLARTEAGRQVRAGEVTHAADVVFSTIPPGALAAVLEPAPPAAISGALAAVRTRAMVLVYLVVPRPQYTPFDAHYFPERDIRIARLSEPKNYRDGPDPAATTVLCAEIACDRGDAMWLAGDDELAAVVTADLRRAGLPSPDPVHIESRRLPAVYPVYEAATADARRTIDDWQQELPDVLAFGRQGLSVPDNIHHVLAMGTGAADALGADGTVDHAAWQTRRSEFATHVVQD